MHKGKQFTILVEDKPTNVCQVVESFWIPHDMVESEEDATMPINDVNL